MNRPAVFFDRDNTLIACDGYLGDPDKVVLVDGAADAVARVRELGFAAVVFSNQSGVARGMFPEEAVHAVNHRLDDLLHEENPRATIDRHDFCPYHPTAKVERYRIDSDLRKPRPGMIYQAASVLGLDLKRSWVVGDAPRDIAAGQAAGLRTVLLKIASLPPSPATSEGAGASPDFVASSLAEAIDFIARHRDDPQEHAASTTNQDNDASPAARGEAAVAAEPTGRSATPTADAWTSSGGSSSPAVSSAGASASAASGASSAASESSTSSTARAEEPVKLTPQPKSEATTPAAADKPDAGKPRQGGFVVKPNQPAPIGMTWGERMRLAKEGSGAISSAAAAAKPIVPRADASRPSAPVKPPEVPPEPVDEAPQEPVRERPTEPPVEPAPEPTPELVSEQPEAEAPAEPQAATEVEIPSPEPEPQAPEATDDDTANRELAAIGEPSVAETAAPPVDVAPTTADESPAGSVEQEPPVLPGSDVPRDVGTSADDVPVATAPAAESRRGLRREDLLDHAFDLPPGGDEDTATPRRRRDAPAGSAEPVGDLSRVEALLEQVLGELRRREDLAASDFSASKLVAGITQVLALASLFYAYFNKENVSAFQSTLLVAIALQTLTISLLIMGRQK